MADVSHDATDDDAHADGDPMLDDIDAAELDRLADLIDDVQAQPEGDARNMAALGLWHAMYGAELVVL